MTNFTYSQAALDRLQKSDREIFDALMHEEVRQSEGFHPKPRMMFPSALSLGIAGLDEVFEVDLAAPLGAVELRERLVALAPPGLEIVAVESVAAGARKARAKCLWYELPVPAERGEETAR